MWKKLKELREKRGTLLADNKAVMKTAEDGKRDLSAEELKKIDDNVKTAEAIDAQIRTLEGAADLEQRTLEGAGNGSAAGEENRGGQPGREDIFGDLPEKDQKRYSLMHAIQLRAEGKPLDGVEAECHQELIKRTGKKPQGIYVPWGVLATRAFDTTAGVGAKQTTVVYGSFIELLRARTLTATLGAQILSGLVGELSIPKQTAGATAQWIAEAGSATASAAVIGQVPLAPKTVSAYTDITRKMMLQTSLDVEAFVRDDLVKTLAIALDAAAFNGTGASNQPLGLLQNSDIGTISLGTDGAALAFANLVAMETAVAAANADLGSLAYATNAKVRGKLKTTLENATSGAGYIWKTDNTVNGYRAFASNIIPGNLTKGTGTNLSAGIFGNFADLIIGIWGGGLDLMIDPYTLSSSGGVRIVALQDADIQVRHAESFSKTVDIVTA